MKTITNLAYKAPVVTAAEAAEEREVLQTALACYAEHCDACARHTCGIPACEKATTETYNRRAAIARKLAEGFRS